MTPIEAAEGEMLRRYRKELREILGQFAPTDLRLGEVLALIAILAPVAARMRGAAAEPTAARLTLVR